MHRSGPPPGWIGWVVVIVIGLVGATLTERIPAVHNATAWQRGVAAGIGGAAAAAVVWCLAYCVFGVDLP